jgi:hypothetical protein
MAKTFFNLFAVVIVSALLLSGRMYFLVKAGARTFWPAIVDQLPFPLALNDGVLSTPEGKRYEVRVPGEKEAFLLIDVTGRTESLEDSPARLLLASRRYHLRKSDQETRILDYPKTSILVDRQKALAWGRNVERWLTPLLFFVVSFFSLLFRTIELCLLGGLAVVYAKVLGRVLTYPQGLQAALWGIAPAMIIHALLGLADMRLGWMAGLLITFVGALAALHTTDFSPEKAEAL